MVVENGIAHGKRLTAWERIDGVKMICDELGPKMTIPRVIRVKSKEFTGTICLSRSQAHQTWEIVHRNMDPDRIEVITVSSADLAFLTLGTPIIYWLFGTATVTIAVLAYLIARRKPVRKFTWVDYGLVLQAVSGVVSILVSWWWPE